MIATTTTTTTAKATTSRKLQVHFVGVAVVAKITL